MNLQGITFQSLDFWCGLSRLNSYFRDVLQIFDGGMGSRRYHDGQVQAVWGASYLIRFNGGVGVHAMSLFSWNSSTYCLRRLAAINMVVSQKGQFTP